MGPTGRGGGHLSWLSPIRRSLGRRSRLPQVPGGGARPLGTSGGRSGGVCVFPTAQGGGRCGRLQRRPGPGASVSPTPTQRVSANRHTGRASSRGTWRTGPDGPRCAGARDPRRLGFSAALPECPGLGRRATAARVRGSEAGKPQPGSGGPQRDALTRSSARLSDSGRGKSTGQTGGPDEGRDPPPLPEPSEATGRPAIRSNFSRSFLIPLFPKEWLRDSI